VKPRKERKVVEGSILVSDRESKAVEGKRDSVCSRDWYLFLRELMLQ